MSDVKKLADRLAELQAERDGLAVQATREDAAERARSWLDGARARASETAGLVANGHATDEALQAVLAAFVLSDSCLADWLVAGQEAMVGRLTERQTVSKLKQLDSAISKASGELRELRKREAIEAVEREFSQVA